ncbi:nf-x1 finger and helicase domain containing protein [Grosmannia clavigera kw1407]|uniref:Nf-x1 finger and helicase domain containing protein n=1 Tax=Grosmannia clavigera (strain kw1407 / UAMH 11150) TaxID=655863 RepID=F0XL83_GROCL|nr:nf-x1 finger and helicase domain containing protein [Grosmannia clavigera kw1407]EFX01411.1 nf-x1 finger and helicase domain containing protein [Grosmannia clavigera kw1407]
MSGRGSEDAGAKQEAIKLLATEEGFRYIRDVVDTHIPEAMACGITQKAALWESEVSPLFLFVTHKSVTGSAFLEEQVASIYNFLVGVGGKRMNALFNFVIVLAKDPNRPTPPTNMVLVELSLAVLAQMISSNTTNMANDDFRVFVDELATLATAGNAVLRDELSQRRTNTYASYIRRRLQVGDNLPDFQPNLVAASVGPVPSFRFRSDFPGHLSADGRRHGNDYADIARISIMPTYEEIMCDRSEYLPVTDPEQWHRQGISGRLDREFRLLREDTVGQLRDVVRMELDNLIRLEKEKTAPGQTKQRAHAASGKDNIRYCTYQDANIIRLDFERRTGLEFVVRFQQPAPSHVSAGGSNGLGGKAAQLHKRRIEWWTRAKKRLQPGGLLCAIDFRGSVLFFTVAHSTLRTLQDAGHRKKDGKENTEEEKVKPVTLADDALHSYVRLNLVGADKMDHVKEALKWFLQSKTNTSGGSLWHQQRVLVEFPGILLDAFQHTLRALQTASQKMDVPFADLIAPTKTLDGVVGNGIADVPPPIYAQKPGFVFDLGCLRNVGSNEILQHSIQKALEPEKLEANSCLDRTQSKALTQTLSRSMALIQGPPGTGKTYVGVEIIKVLLGNKKSAKLGPILCVCYTNHALDQLLEHLLDYSGTGQIIRMGSGSKSERLKNRGLRDVAGKITRTREERKSMWARGTDLDSSTEELQELSQRISRALPLAEIVRFLWENHMAHYKQLFRTNVLLMGHGKNAIGAKDEDGYRTVLGKPDQKIREWLGGGKREDGRRNPRRKPEDLEEADLHTLTHRERHDLYKWWEKCSFQEVTDEIVKQNGVYAVAKRSFDLACREVDLRCLNEADVIGVTTTGLARNIELLRHLSSKVLFCEEAGEVLEAHVLTSLLPSIEHAILIGDHQQLRPQVQNYELRSDNPRGQQFSFDMSLFERLVVPQHSSELQLPLSQLATQRRMHPSISALIRAPLYPELEDGESVGQYPEIPGLVRRLFWLRHCQPELGAADGPQADPTTASRTNSFEVEMTAALVSHIAKQGVYASGDIAVLTPYLGQMQLLQRRLASMFEISFNDRDLEELEAAEAIDGAADETTDITRATAASSSLRRGPQPARTTLLRSVRVATVDNFQGEEAKLIIVSLVRSNPQQRCGFLSTANRINVLLSRAKHGMVIIGNSDTCARVPMWRQVVAMLEAKGNIGEKLPLCCPRHPERTFEASNPDHFLQFSPDGGCLLRCDKRLFCGHACTGRCHSDIVHQAVECLEPCPRPLRGCDHNCPRPCGKECIIQCNVVLEDSFLTLPCGHQRIAPRCFEMQRPQSIKCMERVVRTVPGCGHTVQVACHTNVSEDAFPCTAKCGSPSVCGERCPGQEFCQVCGHKDVLDQVVDFIMMTTYRDTDVDEDPCIFPDCGHVLAMSSMDGIMDMTKHYAMHEENGQVHPASLLTSSAPFDMAEVKVCPNCRGSLRSVARYGRIVRRALLDESTKKFIAWANQQHQVLFMRFLAERERLETEAPSRNNNESWKSVVSKGRESGIRRLVRAADATRYAKLSKLRDDIRCYARKVHMGEQPFQRVADLVQFARRKRQGEHEEQTPRNNFNFDESVIQVRCHMVATILLLRCDIFALQDVYDLVCKPTLNQASKDAVSIAMQKMVTMGGTTELIKDCEASITLAQGAKCVRQEVEGHICFAQLCHLFRNMSMFDPARKDEARETIKEAGLAHVEDAKLLVEKSLSAKSLEPELVAAERALSDAPFYKPVTTAELKAVYTAMSREFSGTGHWYTCAQGHYFTVGECGMPMEQTRCPECGSPVGGRDHTSVEGVRAADDVERIARELNQPIGIAMSTFDGNIREFPDIQGAQKWHFLLRKVADKVDHLVGLETLRSPLYEDVWIALAKALDSRVHVDPYRMQLYQSLAVKESKHRFSDAIPLAPEAPGLVGFLCANTAHEGCLSTANDAGVHMRIHSCENGTSHCSDMGDASVVWIQPIVSRLSHGRGDFIEAAMCDLERQPRKQARRSEPETISRTITFPYSRHSSYPELCHLLSELRPKDVWPCTVNPDRWFQSGSIVTIKDLFGEFCSGDVFRHDEEVASKWKQGLKMVVDDSQATADSDLYPHLDTLEADYESVSAEAELFRPCDPPFFAYGGKDAQGSQDSQNSMISEFSMEKRTQAHDAMLMNAAGGRDWNCIGLLSTNDRHTLPDEDLGVR